MHWLVVCLFVVACGSDKSEPTATPSGSAKVAEEDVRKTWRVMPVAAELECEADSDCTTVETKCIPCCSAAAISRAGLEPYLARFAQRCEGQGGQGEVCNCTAVAKDPVCRNNLCALVPHE